MESRKNLLRSAQEKEKIKIAKYLRMLKMGIPRQGVENKMREEGLDPCALDDVRGVAEPEKEAEEEVSLKHTNAPVEASLVQVKKMVKKKKEKLKRKKLF